MSVLFVCLGNICRSPTAEAVFRTVSAVPCDSAGTSGWHIGEPPYGPMQDAARAQGIDMSGLRARQFVAQDFERFDLLIAMDPTNVSDMERLRLQGNTTPIRLLAPYADPRADTVPDPYYTRDFEGTLDMVHRAIDALAKDLG